MKQLVDKVRSGSLGFKRYMNESRNEAAYLPWFFLPLKIEETSTEVTNRRSKVSFSPKDITEVVSSDSTDFSSLVSPIIFQTVVVS